VRIGPQGEPVFLFPQNLFDDDLVLDDVVQFIVSPLVLLAQAPDHGIRRLNPFFLNRVRVFYPDQPHRPPFRRTGCPDEDALLQLVPRHSLKVG